MIIRRKGESTKEEGLAPARLSSLESQRNAEKRKIKNEGVPFHTLVDFALCVLRVSARDMFLVLS
jgi:hypothetical protein